MTTEENNQGPAIVIMGSPTSGYKFFGPFATVDEAVAELEKLAVVPSCSIDILRLPSELPFRMNK